VYRNDLSFEGVRSEGDNEEDGGAFIFSFMKNSKFFLSSGVGSWEPNELYKLSCRGVGKREELHKLPFSGRGGL